MNTFRILKTNKLNTLYGVITWLFVFCGGKFYLDWLLVTNPTSKNPILRFIYGFTANGYTAKKYRNRYKLAVSLGIVHVIGFILFYLDDGEYTLTNILVNVYPVIVQLYIGYRCWIVKESKNNVA